jgi:hypothetical protein
MTPNAILTKGFSVFTVEFAVAKATVVAANAKNTALNILAKFYKNALNYFFNFQLCKHTKLLFFTKKNKNPITTKKKYYKYIYMKIYV